MISVYTHDAESRLLFLLKCSQLTWGNRIFCLSLVTPTLINVAKSKQTTLIDKEEQCSLKS